MRRFALTSLLCISLAGCGGTAIQSAPRDEAGSDRAEAQADIRAAIPATEAYFADNGTYEGVSPEKLRSTYDQGVEGVRFEVANARTYCVESTVGSAVHSKRGPAADITAGPC